jgi:hypothetical protein
MGMGLGGDTLGVPPLPNPLPRPHEAVAKARDQGYQILRGLGGRPGDKASWAGLKPAPTSQALSPEYFYIEFP